MKNIIIMTGGIQLNTTNNNRMKQKQYSLHFLHLKSYPFNMTGQTQWLRFKTY